MAPTPHGRLLSLLVCGLAIVFALPARAEEADPHLPPGAIRRLGLVRLPTDGVVGGLAISADGKWLAASAAEASLHVWDLKSGRRAATLVSTEKHPISCMAFSPDGQMLAAGDSDATVQLRQTTDGTLHRLLRGHGSSVTAVAFAPDGRTLASADADRAVILWSVRGRMLRRLPDHPRDVTCLAYADEGRILVAGCADGTIYLWDPLTGRQRRCWKTGSSAVHALLVMPDGKSVLAEGGEHALRLWDVSSGREIRQFRGHTAGVLALAQTRNGKKLASTSADGMIRVWTVADGAEIHHFSPPQTTLAALAFLPDGNTLVVGNRDRVLDFWLLRRGTVLQLMTGHRSAIHHITFAVGGQEIITRAERESLRWERKTGKLLGEIPARRETGGPGPIIALSPDGKIRAIAQGRAIVCREERTGQPICELNGHEADVSALAFAPDGRTLLSGGNDTTAVIWDLPACFPLPTPARRGRMEESLTQAWSHLASGRSMLAFRALRKLHDQPEKALPFLSGKLPPPRDEVRLRRLLADLDSDTFAVRENASSELAKLGRGAEEALRRALHDKPSLEMRRRIEFLLADIPADLAEVRRWERVVLLLEWQSTPKAREILQTLARSTAGPEATQDARAALARLDSRAKKR